MSSLEALESLEENLKELRQVVESILERRNYNRAATRNWMSKDGTKVEFREAGNGTLAQAGMYTVVENTLYKFIPGIAPFRLTLLQQDRVVVRYRMPPALHSAWDDVLRVKNGEFGFLQQPY